MDQIVQTLHVHMFHWFVIVQSAKHIEIKTVILFYGFVVVIQIIKIIYNLRIELAGYL